MQLPLSSKQREIIIGTVLGDGSLEFDGYKGTRLQIKQSARHKEYVMWLFKNLIDLCKSAPKRKKDTGQWYFSTRHINELTDFQRIFYSGKKKIVPKRIKELLVSPLSLAVWYMDDGKLDFIRKVHCSPSLCTDSFSFDEVKMLIDVLDKNFRVKANIQNSSIRGKIYPRIYIKAITRDRFFSIIRRYILNSFSYKLPPL